MIFGIGLSLVFSLLLCVHVVRTGKELYWLFIILAFQPLGGLVYFVMYILPELTGGATARKLTRAAQDAVDPERDFRLARTAAEDSPTVANQMKLAAAAAASGRHEEAKDLYAQAAQGIHADDPTLILGQARALVELERSIEALPLLDRLGDLGEAGRTPQAALVMGRAYHALGRTEEADQAYGWAAGRLPGLEGLARYAAFLAEHGRRGEAEEAMVEIEKRSSKTTAHFRKEARFWRDFARAALGNAR
jgi:hypothetical protein